MTDQGGNENGKPIDQNLGNGNKCCDLIKVQAGAEIDDSQNTQITMDNFAIAKNSVHQSLAGAILIDFRRDGIQTSGERTKEDTTSNEVKELAPLNNKDRVGQP